MTDRELLELAAKAAGIELWHEDVFTNGLTQKVSDSGILMWNPLLKDGDALRLAVKLRLVISTTHVTVMAYEPSTMSRGAAEPIGSDPYAATRRTITRTAAEIGRTTP